MSTKRTRFSPPPFRAKNEIPRGPWEEAPTPRAAWSQQPNDIGWGPHPDELWGVAKSDRFRSKEKKQ